MNYFIRIILGGNEGMYYKARFQGLTDDIQEAYMYTEEEAQAISHVDRNVELVPAGVTTAEMIPV